jgi:hypothetical protein
VNPLQVPPTDPYGERYPFTGHFYVSLNIFLFIFPSESPVRESPPCSLTGSPWIGILHQQSHWSIYSFIHVCLLESQKRAVLHMGKNIRSPSMEPHADGRPTYNGVWPGSPRGSLTTLLSLPKCHAAFSTIPSTLARVDQSAVSQHVVATPIRVYLPQLSCLPHDLGYSRVQIYDTPRYRRGVGFMGGWHAHFLLLTI